MHGLHRDYETHVVVVPSASPLLPSSLRRIKSPAHNRCNLRLPPPFDENRTARGKCTFIFNKLCAVSSRVDETQEMYLRLLLNTSALTHIYIYILFNHVRRNTTRRTLERDREISCRVCFLVATYTSLGNVRVQCTTLSTFTAKTQPQLYIMVESWS